MSETITSTVWGIAPWNDELLIISGDVDRGRLPAQAYHQQASADFVEGQDVLREANITHRSLEWGSRRFDYLRTIALRTRGLQEDIQDAPLKRWFDTNTFYMQPTIQGVLRTEPFKETEFAGGIPTVLSPYSFLKLSNRGEHTTEAEAERYVNDLYDQLLDDAVNSTDTVLFHEPYATYHQVGEQERQKLRQSIGRLATEHPDWTIGLYFSFGDAGQLLADFADDDRVSILGCDVQKTPIASLPKLPNHRFLAGVVDGSNTLVRDDQAIIEDIDQIHTAVDPAELSITHTIDLEHLPRTTAFTKITQLGRIAENLQEA